MHARQRFVGNIALVGSNEELHSSPFGKGRLPARYMHKTGCPAWQLNSRVSRWGWGIGVLEHPFQDNGVISLLGLWSCGCWSKAGVFFRSWGAAI